MKQTIVLCVLTILSIAVPSIAAAEKSPSDESIELSAELRQRCIDVLRAGFGAEEFWPSMHAAEALTLAGYGEEVRAGLLKRAPHVTDDQQRCGIARELVRAGDRTQAATLLEILSKPDDYAHTHAAESLYKVYEIGDGTQLRAAMADASNPTCQLMAAAALARSGSPQALAFIREQLAAGESDARKIAAWILARVGDAEDIPALRANYERETDPLKKSYYVNALAALGDSEGQKRLEKNLGDADPAIRTYAAVFAGDAGMAGVAPQLEKLLNDPELDVRIRAAQSLIALSQSPEDASPFFRDVFPATAENPRYSEGSIIVLRDGTLLYATTEFIGSGSDFAKARIIAKTSADGGRTWSDPRVLQENIGGKNVMSVTLRRLPKSGSQPAPIGMFFLIKNDFNDLRAYLRIANDEGQTFGERILVTDGPGYHVVNNDRITVLKDGRLLCPVAWTADVEKVNHFTCYCAISDDGGRTWRRGKGEVDQPKRGAMEPEVLELDDGRVLMIVRTQLGYIAAAESSDGGDTWSEAKSWGVKSPEAPATLRRIPSTGDLLLIWNHTYEAGAGHGGKRTPLTAAVSTDEGRTWSLERTLEKRDNETYAYTSVTFDRGRALISYYVGDDKTGRISSRFVSLPVSWFYEQP